MQREIINVLTCYTLDATPSSVCHTLEKLKKLYWSLSYIQESCLVISSNIYLFTSSQMVDGGLNDKTLKTRQRAAPYCPLTFESDITSCQLIVLSMILTLFHQIIVHITWEIMECKTFFMFYVFMFFKKHSTPPNVQQCCFIHVKRTEIRHTLPFKNRSKK